MRNLGLRIDTALGLDLRYIPVWLEDQKANRRKLELPSFIAVYDIKPKLVWMADSATKKTCTLQLSAIDVQHQVIVWDVRISGVSPDFNGLQKITEIARAHLSKFK